MLSNINVAGPLFISSIYDSGNGEIYTDKDGYMTPIPQGASDEHNEDEEVDIHMPGLSYFPFITGIGLSVSGFGFAIYSQFNVVGLTVAIVGILATFFGAYGWCFEPADPEDHH